MLNIKHPRIFTSRIIQCCGITIVIVFIYFLAVTDANVPIDYPFAIPEH